MTKNQHTQNRLLMERIEQNFEDFKRETEKSSPETIFDIAATIAAVQDAYFYMTTHDWADDYETEYLLSFENPLRLLADAWEELCEDRGREFGKMLTELAENGGRYMTVSAADELREKYGEDIPLNTAALLEMVEIGKKIADYCDDDEMEDSFWDMD
jgi:hypothetical protein